MVLAGNDEVIFILNDLNTQPAEGIENRAEVGNRYILDSYAISHHSCHSDKRADLYHIRENPVFCPMQRLHTLYGNQVAGYTADFRTHRIEQVAELLDIRFAGSIVYRRCSLRQHGSHDDVGRTRHRCLVQQHISADKAVGLYLVDITVLDTSEVCPEVLETQEMRIETAAADFVPPRLGYRRLAEAT